MAPTMLTMRIVYVFEIKKIFLTMSLVYYISINWNLVLYIKLGNPITNLVLQPSKVDI